MTVRTGGGEPSGPHARRSVPPGEPEPELLDALRALDNDRRLQILRWLQEPTRHFRPQVDGDLVEDGVCGLLIAEKLGVSQPTVSEHMRLLVRAGLVRDRSASSSGRSTDATTIGSPQVLRALRCALTAPEGGRASVSGFGASGPSCPDGVARASQVTMRPMRRRWNRMDSDRRPAHRGSPGRVDRGRSGGTVTASVDLARSTRAGLPDAGHRRDRALVGIARDLRDAGVERGAPHRRDLAGAGLLRRRPAAPRLGRRSWSSILRRPSSRPAATSSTIRRSAAGTRWSSTG